MLIFATQIEQHSPVVYSQKVNREQVIYESVNSAFGLSISGEVEEESEENWNDTNLTWYPK